MTTDCPGTSLSSRYWLLGLLLVLVTPALSMAVSGLVEGMGLVSVVRVVGEQFFIGRGNLGMISVLGLVPFLLLAALIWILDRLFYIECSKKTMFLTALFVMVVIIFWSSMDYWRTYLPDRKFMSWPHGLELVIGPLFFAPVGMVLGVLAGWFIARFG